MKRNKHLPAAWLCSVLLPAALLAQTYQVDWHSADGGGVLAGKAGNGYVVVGAVGQSDAALANGGTYGVSGGFWSLEVVMTPGAPLLEIVPVGAGVRLQWEKPALGYVIEQAASLNAPVSWTEMVPPYQTNATHNYIDIPVPQDHRIYRLHTP